MPDHTLLHLGRKLGPVVLLALAMALAISLVGCAETRKLWGADQPDPTKFYADKERWSQ